MARHSQFLSPSSLSTRQIQTDTAAGILDAPQGMSLAQNLVNKGRVPLTPENVALGTRALGYEVGPVASTVPAPRRSTCSRADRTTARRSSRPRGGSIEGATPDAPATAAEIERRTAESEARRAMYESAEHPLSIAEHSRHMPDDLPCPTTVQSKPARARVEEVLKVLDDLAKRHKGHVSAWDI